MNVRSRPILVSVHVPKSSGTSLRVAFARAVPPNRLILDYADDPVDPAAPSPRQAALRVANEHCRLRGVRVIHGHFPIQKYDALPSAERAVMLREPVENVISVYFFWRHLVASGNYGGHALFRSFAAERPSIIEFARLPTFRYLYSRTFFDGYDMRRFAIVGDFAERDRYWDALSAALGVKLDRTVCTNETPPSDERDQLRSSRHLIRTLSDTLREDIEFYERWAKRGGAARSQLYG